MIPRDAHFWRRIANHPEVAPTIASGYLNFDVSEIVQHPRVISFSNAHGGYLFYCLDVLTTTFEVHALITPEGRGRSAWLLAVNALTTMFDNSARIIIAHEVLNRPMSRCPRSFGFELAGQFEETSLGTMRPWVLTQNAWFRSHAHKTMVRRCLQ